MTIGDEKRFVTWKAKTDTNALPFNDRNRLLSVQYPFEMDHVKIC